MRKRSHLLAQIRQLARLGLQAEVFVYEALPLVAELLPGARCAFFWLDESGLIANTCFRNPVPGLLHAAGAADSSGSSNARIVDTSFKRRLLAAGADHELQDFELKLAQGARAMLSVVRVPARGRPDATTQGVLEGALRYLAMGAGGRVRALPDLPIPPGPGSQEELVVCDADGRMSDASDGAQVLLMFASSDRLTPASLALMERDVARFLAELCAGAAQAGANSRSSCMHRSAWGRFSLDVFGLGTASGRCRQFAVRVQRHAAARLRLLQTMGASFSQQQRETALLISGGMSNREIASALGVSPNTAAYHVKRVYAKMSVHSRQELLTRLLAMSDGASR